MPTLVKKRRHLPVSLRFRLQRLFLTPMVRGGLRYGFPLLIVSSATAYWLASEGTVDRIHLWNDALVQRMFDRPEVLIQGLTIEASSPDVREALKALVPQKFPASVSEFNIGELKKQAESIPAVVTADVRLVPGSMLFIEAIEREPAIFLRKGEVLSVVDETGVHITNASRREDYPELPLIVGAGAGDHVPEAIAILDALGNVRRSVRGLVRMGMRRWDIVLDRGRRVLLPDESPIQAVHQLLMLEQTELILQRQVSIIDLRNPQRTTLRLETRS